MKVAVLSRRHWWLARRLDAAGHTVRCFTDTPRAAGEGFVEKLTAPLLQEGTDLLVCDGPFPAQERMAAARKVPVIGGACGVRVPAAETFRSLEQGLAYVATHRGPWAVGEHTGLDGQDAGRLLRWRHGRHDPLTLSPWAPSATWRGGWSDGRRVVGPFTTWSDDGSTTTARRIDQGGPLAKLTSLGGYVGFLAARCDRDRVLEVCPTLPPAVGLLLDGDLASQWARLGRGELDAMTTRHGTVTTTAVPCDEPAGFPLAAEWLGKSAVLADVRMRDGGLTLAGSLIGWRWGEGPPTQGKPTRTAPGSALGVGRDADSLGDDSNDEGAPGSEAT